MINRKNQILLIFILLLTTNFIKPLWSAEQNFTPSSYQNITVTNEPTTFDEASSEEYFEEHVSLTAKIKKNIILRFEKIFSPQVTIFLISMLPIFELRGSIPIGINYFELPPLRVYLISITGNMLPIFFILLFWGWVTEIFNKVPILKRFLDFIFKRTRARAKMIEKYEELALIFFVAIPLPITGAWTGSLAAYLLGLKFWKSVLCIFLGVLTAGLVVTSLSLLGWTGAIIALTVLTLLFFCKLIILIKKRSKELDTATISLKEDN